MVAYSLFIHNDTILLKTLFAFSGIRFIYPGE